MVGTEKFEAGLIFSGNNFAVVKKIGKTGEEIPKHDHPEENIIFTVLKGKMQVFLNETEEHILTPGTIMHFDGVNSIQATFVEDSEIQVTLIKK